jgi:hypothetical protein
VDVAAAMDDVCEREGWEFTLAVGDNFYDTGISGDVHGEDARHRFRNTYEEVYLQERREGWGALSALLPGLFPVRTSRVPW